MSELYCPNCGLQALVPCSKSLHHACTKCRHLVWIIDITARNDAIERAAPHRDLFTEKLIDCLLDSEPVNNDKGVSK